MFPVFGWPVFECLLYLITVELFQHRILINKSCRSLAQPHCAAKFALKLVYIKFDQNYYKLGATAEFRAPI